MKILVINCGSSSIKYKLYDFPSVTTCAKGVIEKVGERGSSIRTHTQGVKVILSGLLKERSISSPRDLGAVGHRIVHGGEAFHKPHLIDKRVVAKIEEFSQFAPLHNPANLQGVKACAALIPGVPQVAVFDTAFHQTIPAYAFSYAIPREFYSRYGVRKYGFHGSSHQYVAGEAARILKRPLRSLRLIICHLGNGCSITAVDRGKSVDTSMGFTPLEGVMMGTRSGDVDTAAVFCIMEKGNISIKEMDSILNKKSGLLGVSGISNDVRVLKQKAARGKAGARLALDMFFYRIKKYIGAYYFVLGGADAVCFTAGIGENNPDLIGRLGREVSPLIRGRTRILVIPTDEELMIGRLSYEVIRRKRR